MKRENSFYYNLLILTFIICFVVSFILSGTSITISSFKATASVVIYPLTYLLATLFCERYGKNKTFSLFVYAIFAIILTAILSSFAGLLPLDKGFNINFDYQLMFAMITSFAIGQSLNLILYYYLEQKRKLNFLVSSIIAITFDSLIFIILGYMGNLSMAEMFKMFSGQYIISVIIMFIYSFFYANIIPTVIKTKPVEETKIKEIKASNKKENTKKTTKPKTTTTKKSTTKKIKEQ